MTFFYYLTAFLWSHHLTSVSPKLFVFSVLAMGAFRQQGRPANLAYVLAYVLSIITCNMKEL